MIIKTLLWSFFAVFGSSMALAEAGPCPENPPTYSCPPICVPDGRGGAICDGPIDDQERE